jgi:CBS domain-containing protein
MMDILFILVTKSGYKASSLTGEGTLAAALATTAGDALAISKAWRLSLNPALDLGARVDENAPLSELLTLMWGGWHRVPVTAAGDSAVIEYVSQSDVTRFFANNAGALKSQATLDASLADLGLGPSPTKPLVTASSALTAYDVAVRLVQANVSAAPIVDADSGVIVANFSSSDLRFLTRYTLPLLQLPVLDFLSKVSHANNPYVPPPSLGGATLLTPQTLKECDSFSLALFKATALRCHRLWIVDEAGKPTGVVSLGDLMRVFLYGK